MTQWRADGGKQSAEEKATIELDEFVEAICRIASLVTPMPKKASRAHQVLSLFERYLGQGAVLSSNSWNEPEDECIQLAKTHEPELRKLFVFYASQFSEGERAGQLQCKEFMLLLEECELTAVKNDLTLAHAVELFTMVNHEEVD